MLNFAKIQIVEGSRLMSARLLPSPNSA